MNNAIVQNHKFEVKGDEFVVRGYVSIDGTGNSYNLKPLADNLDLYSGGSNSSWGTKYKNALNSFGPLTSSNLISATQYARASADAGRAEPGTARFNALLDTIKGINNWDIKSSTNLTGSKTGGAALVMSSYLYNFDAQWDLSKRVKVIGLLVGADARVYEVVPDGNNFVDFSRSINPYFDPKFTPRVAAVYTYNKVHNFRFTFQQGYRFPSLFEALSFVNNSGTRRVGSLPFINQGLGYLDKSYYQSSFNAFKSAIQNGTGLDTAKKLLQQANLPNARPEKITSFEIGYKSVLLDNKLVIDFDAYTNIYD